MLDYFRAFIVGLAFIFQGIFFFFVFLFRMKHPSNSALFCHPWAAFSMKILNAKLVLLNKEQLHANQPCVFIGNHQSNWDIVIVGSIFPKQTVCIGKKSLSYLPLFGWLFYMAGNILINRKDHTKAMNSLGAAASAIKDDKVSILIFPEGTRSHGSGLGKFKKGAFFTAAQAGVPIVPIAFCDYQQTLHPNSLKKSIIYAEVLAPVSTAGVAKEDLPALITKTHKQFEEKIAELTKKAIEANQSPNT